MLGLMDEEGRRSVWISHKDERCAKCGAELVAGGLIAMDRVHGIRCLACAELAGLEFLPSGDMALTRRALARSSRSAIVLKFSRARKRSERQGVRVEAAAIQQAESDNVKDSARRETQRERRRVRDEVAEKKYIADFTARVLALFPRAPARRPSRSPPTPARSTAGASAARPGPKPSTTRRSRWPCGHTCVTPAPSTTGLLATGLDPREAREAVRPAIERVVERWRATAPEWTDRL